jgi:hypothetical protein
MMTIIDDAFYDEWRNLAHELASATGMPFKTQLDAAYDLLPELRAFASVWDLCAASEKEHHEKTT